MLPWVGGSILITLCIVVGGIWGMTEILRKAGFLNPITVAIVTPEDEADAQMITQFIGNMESVKSICEFHYYPEDKAKKAVVSGEVQAALIVDDDYEEDLNSAVHVILPEEMSLNELVFRELLTDAVSMIHTADSATYAAMDTGSQYETKVSRRKVESLLTKLYLEQALKRGQIYDKSTVSSLGQWDLYQYYYVSGFLICLLMCGLNFGFFYQERETDIEEKLRVFGVGQMGVSVGKVLVMGFLLWLLAVCFYGVSCMVAVALDLWFLSFNMPIILALFPLCLAVAGLFHLAYVYGGSGGGLLLFTLNLLMITCSGALLPTAFLPDPIQRISGWSPFAIWDRYCLDFLFDKISWQPILYLCLMAFAGCVGGAVRRWKR